MESGGKRIQGGGWVADVVVTALRVHELVL